LHSPLRRGGSAQRDRVQRGVHLPVAIDLHDDIETIGNGGLIPAQCRTANTLILFVTDDSHASIGTVVGGEISAFVKAVVIDEVDAIDFGSDHRNDLQDRLQTL
jgi:hypothetical protein